MLLHYIYRTHRMAKKANTAKRMLATTKKHIMRNKWLSMASVIVIALTFLIVTTFTGLVIITQRTIASLEQKAQIIVFFLPDTPEEEILAIQEDLQKNEAIESVDYTSKEEALEAYRKDFADDPTLVESITSDALPPSLDIRATEIEMISEIIKELDELKASNENIEEIMYFKDVVESLRSISEVIRIGGAAIVIALSATTVLLILITIGFNINAHKHEIEVMQLVGSTDTYIRTPFLLEGAFYGIVGAAISITLLLGIWYTGIQLLKESDMFVFVSQTFTDIDMPYLKEADPRFIAMVIGAELAFGALLGYISSLLATWRYLKQ